MAMEQARLWSLSSLATELRRNPRTIAKALSRVVPDGKIGKRSGWFMASAASALQEYEAKSNGIVRMGNEDALLSQIARLAAEVEAGMQRLRTEPDRSRRLELLRTFGAKVGALDRAMKMANAREGSDGIVILEPFRDRLIGGLVQEIASLI